MTRNYDIEFDGKLVARLNESLAIRQKVSDEQLVNLVRLHEVKRFVFNQMCKSEDASYLRGCASLVTEIEFALQRNWNFGEDESFHEWYLVPKCTCPKMDNADSRGSMHGRVINLDCMIHGQAF